MSRASEPSARVAEILEEDRPRRPLELPPTLATGRYVVGRQAVLGVALVVALAVAMLGGRYLLARGDAQPQAVAPQPAATSGTGDVGAEGETSGASTGGSPFASGGATSGGAVSGVGSPSSAEVTVHVVGQVERPGVVTLPAGSRVGAALDEAGGTTSRADLTGVNLARPLVDGEQVVVPRPGETVTAAPGAPGASGAPAGAPAAGGGAAPGTGGLVDLNTADLATLETLPGVGPVLAQRIVDWRTEHGRFTAVEELGEVSGIGDKIYAQLSPKVTV